MSAVQKLLARVRNPAVPPAVAVPVKRPRKGLTCGELNDAIFAVCAVMAPCTARDTLETLGALTGAGDTPSAGNIVVLDGPAPVSRGQFDDALAEAHKFESDLPAGTLKPLTRFRGLLAEAEARKAKEPVQYLTVSQAKARDAALLEAIGWALGATAAELDRGQPSKAHLLSTLGRSANTPERRKVFDAADRFDESKLPQRTQEQWLRYQSSGRW